MDAVVTNRFEARPSLRPPDFRIAGRVMTARFCAAPLLPRRNKRTTAAQKFGKRYEGRVLDLLSKQFANIRRCPWISFETDRVSYRLCQPDALIIGQTGADITIVEIKARHTIDAFWQLRHLYAPVVQNIFPSHKLRLLEIVKSFDGAVRFPEDFWLHFDLDSWQKELPDLGVVQWKL